jgi:predicted alpha/beta superfamily hydrolase
MTTSQLSFLSRSIPALAALAAGLVLNTGGLAQTATPPTPPAPDRPPLATIDNTEVRLLHSRFVDQDFQISVALPWSYSRGGRTYPVIYVCDANLCFGLVTEMQRMLAARREFPEAIIVGIGYPADPVQCLVLRIRDQTPGRDPAGEARIRQTIALAGGPADVALQPGGAPVFLQFIREELIPFIESNYRAAPGDRTIVGHSTGGLFAMYVLLTQPGTFNRYVASSPSPGWGQDSLFAAEAAAGAARGDLKADVFMSCGARETPEMIGALHRMEDKLRSRGCPQLKLTTHVFPDEIHTSVPPIATSRGLRVVFDKMPKPDGK